MKEMEYFQKIIKVKKCPYCGYMMRILKEKDDELLCYCASCKEDILITKKEDLK